MKRINFDSALKQRILDGSKTVTWRFFDDKDLQVGDELEMTDKESGEVFAQAKILNIEKKKIRETSDDEMKEDRFHNHNEVVEVFKKYYGEGITMDSIVLIVRFQLEK